MESILKFLTLRNCAFGACGACVILLLNVFIQFLSNLFNIIDNTYYWDQHVFAAFVMMFQLGLQVLAYLAMGVFFGIYAYRQPKN